MHDTNLQILFSNATIEMQKISDWLKINKLSLNIKKTHFILFHFRQKNILNNLALHIDNCSIERVSSTKFLGVILQENLNWNIHISTLVNKLSKNLGILKTIQHKLNTNILYMLYNTLIYPYLQYCNIAWASQHSKSVENLFTVQKKAIRIICKTAWNSHTAPLFFKLNTLKLSDINNLQIGCLMFNVINKQLPPFLSQNFMPNASIHSYFTRQSTNIHVDGTRTTLRKYTIAHLGPTLWNALPTFIKSKPSIHAFKSSYKKFLILNYNSTN
jgi:hypothetical protein